VRDIPTVRDHPGRIAEIVARVNSDFDAVLVHGDAGFIPFDVAFPAAPQIADRLHYTGYVTAPPPLPEADMPAGEVLVSVGGGAAGRALLAAAFEARRRGCLADRAWRILAGASLSDHEFARLQLDFAALLRCCHVSVSQAGYNTVLDILAARARAVLVPFAAERETEQLLRAEQVAARGAAIVVRESDLSPVTLAVAIESAAAREPPTIAIDTDGARRAAAIIADLIAR
jgi:predicted glycosyltransferase